jgi:quercetin dioxygenase-like cupin family protein
VDGREYALRPGVSLFIPPHARHAARCTSEIPLRLLFVFPTDRFDEVVYRFDD